MSLFNKYVATKTTPNVTKKVSITTNCTNGILFNIFFLKIHVTEDTILNTNTMINNNLSIYKYGEIIYFSFLLLVFLFLFVFNNFDKAAAVNNKAS